MTDWKKITPNKLLWVDLEMTGLDPNKDLIVEVAAIVTDWDLNELDSFESGVCQDEARLDELFKANPFAMSRLDETKKLMKLSAEGLSETEIEDELLKLVDKHFSKGEPVILAGNSIHSDRGFIKSYLRRLEKRLHYRMLDVSAWKVLMIGKFKVEFAKSESHRALEDIQESISELKYYLEYFGRGDK